MHRKFYILLLSLIVMLPAKLVSQNQPEFVEESDKFREELIKYIGPNLNTEQTANLYTFLANIDSSSFNIENKGLITNIVDQFKQRSMRAVPHFNNLFVTLNTSVTEQVNDTDLNIWLKSTLILLSDNQNNNDFINKYVTGFGNMILNNVLAQSSSGITWKVKDARLKYNLDTAFAVIVENATLMCSSRKDSTFIFNTNGIYYPHTQKFTGTSGKITFEKAGYSPSEVFAEFDNFSLDLNKSNFTIDSALLTHATYFDSPVYGTLIDQSISFKDIESATYPRFTTYEKTSALNNIYEGINYLGVLSFEGAGIKGTGDKVAPATLTFSRNDTLYIKVTSTEFLFAKNRLASSEVSMVLYLDKDSIYHSNLGFSYMHEMRRINMFRANNPISESPYFDSFHELDMSFESLSWNMDESQIIMSKAMGAAQSEAQFESSSFFNENTYLRLQGIDEYHPLVRLKNFAEWYYSNTFPVEDFAIWLNKPVETVMNLCIEMANKGFVFYDRIFNTVTLKQKTFDYVAAFLKRQDYDAIKIISNATSSTNNAVLNLHNYQLTINGISSIPLSAAQNVFIKPYNDRVVIGRNRKFEFDGVVEAGLFTIYGHRFTFDYDTFKIRLQAIDSIKIAVETDQYDAYGNPYISQIDNMIQLGSADIYIDEPYNKSGLRDYEEYPIINTTSYSYIFYDKIPGLEGVYPQGDVYFRIEPFTYEHIDHYNNSDMNLPGEFNARGIFEPIHNNLIIQKDNSLGFKIKTPTEGLSVYNNKGILYDSLSINNQGLVGSGKLSFISSTTVADKFLFTPDSMITTASSFTIAKDGTGIYPETEVEDVAIKWLPDENQFIATNSTNNRFNMFDNGTSLNGSLTLTPTALFGEGLVSTTESLITSNSFNFSAMAIKADTSDYNLMSPSSSGYAFIANNASTHVNFDTGLADFHLNTDTSQVIFPEIQYLCTMTDFSYDMNAKIMDMEQKGKVGSPLLQPEQLLALTPDKYDEPTFFATSTINDTVAFSSWKGRYYVTDEYIEAENINYIPIADALIQPDSGKLTINRRAKIKTLQNAIVAVSNNHIIHDATINIENTKRYSGSGTYDYVDENKFVQQIAFPEITVDTLVTSAKGYIAADKNFMLSPAFGFQGDVNLYACEKNLSFTGSASIIHDCNIKSYPVKFKSSIDPLAVMIPMAEKPRDINDNMIFSGSFVNIDSAHIYPAFLSAQKSWTDAGLVTADGYLWYNKLSSSYIITSKDKIADPSIAGNMVSFDKNSCILSSEGSLNFGSNFDLVNTVQAGNVVHNIDSGNVNIRAMLAFDFYFSNEALDMMKNEFRMMPTLKAVDINSEFFNKNLPGLFGATEAEAIKTDMGLYGALRNIPESFNYELVLNDVNLYWNESSSSFRSKGPIGIGFIGTQPMNVYVDGYIEIQRRKSGDMFDIYLKADNSTWYYFSYIRGNMMTESSNISYNTLISTIKINQRKHPESSTLQPYSYMISVEDRLARFIRRMEEEEEVVDGVALDPFEE